MAAEQELPIFLGLNDRSITEIPKTVEKQRYMTSVAPKASNPGKWIEQPRLPIPTGEHAVIECQGKIHSIAGYAKHRVDQNFHQVFDPKSGTWSLKAPFPHPCNHVAGVSIGSKIFTVGGFVEQNRCPHSKCFVYDSASDQWASIAPISRPRGAMSAIVLDGKIHLLGGRDVRSVEWHEIYDPASDKYTILGGMRGSTGTQPFVGQRDHMGVAVVDGKIHAIAGRMDSYDFNTGLNNARPAGVPRNSLQGPGYADLDLRLSRDFFLNKAKKEKGMVTTLALDAFNALNHPNYVSYVGNLSSPFFGRPVTALPSRRMQITVRFKF